MEEVKDEKQTKENELEDGDRKEEEVESWNRRGGGRMRLERGRRKRRKRY